jgi:hypothetical protein
MLAPVFGAYEFGPSARNYDKRSCVRYGRGPGPRKRAFILDRDFKLQVLAPVIRVEVEWLYARWKADILFGIPVQRLFRNFVIDQPIPVVSITSVSPS